ncbi:hypothetical protein B0H13DRAFT_2327864 [Mycena leptocephala]|nr:hypothetical protein B0H13DRAFT_2327864 [Mycena leptocephala]
MISPCTIPTGSFILKDFQGLCLTVDISGPSLFGPVFTEYCTLRLPGLPQQAWSLVPVNHGNILLSGLSQEAGENIFLTFGSNGQAITAGNTGFGFNITCVPFDANNTVTLVDNLVGTEITLTSSQAEGGNFPESQVNFEPFTGSLEQIWWISTLD